MTNDVRLERELAELLGTRIGDAMCDDCCGTLVACGPNGEAVPCPDCTPEPPEEVGVPYATLQRLADALTAQSFELTETRRARIGDSEIIGREMCRAEKAEADVAALKSALGDIVYIGRAWLTPSSDQRETAMRQRAEAALGRLDYEPAALSEAVKALTAQPAPSGWQQRIAAMDPYLVTQYDDQRCFFCGEYSDGDHKPDCLWQNAVDAGQPAKDAMPPAPPVGRRPKKENLRTAREWVEEYYSYFIDPGKDATDRVKFVNAIMEVVEAACVDALKALPPAPEASPAKETR